MNKKQSRKEKTIKSFHGDKNQDTNTKEVSIETILPSETSEENMNWSEAQRTFLEELRKDLKTQIIETEEKLTSDFKNMKKEMRRI